MSRFSPSDLIWYMQRLRAMSPKELLLRGNRAVVRHVWRFRPPNPPTRYPPSGFGRLKWPGGDDINLLREILLPEGEGILQGRYTILAADIDGTEQQWNRDPLTGTDVSLGWSYGIDYRNPSVVGSIKHIWEKNRLQETQLLAACYRVSGEDAFAARVEQDLRTWCEENPFLKSVNWCSGLEIALRLISLVWIERFLRASSQHERAFGPQGFVWPTICQSRYLIQRDLSVGSSANNHLIGELVGLVVSGEAWPFLGSTLEDWWLLEETVDSQVHEDGFSKEQALGYHDFVLELLLAAIAEDVRPPTPKAARLRQIAARMMAASLFLSDDAGNRPRFGDDDDGRVFGFFPQGPGRHRWHAALSDRLGVAQMRSVDTWAAIVASLVVPEGLREPVAQPLKIPAILPNAGFVKFVSRLPDDRIITSFFDVGPLGMGPLAAHGHADALSFVTFFNGKPVFIDPGNFCYHLDERWRRYFRSTKAHNTLTVDGKDQAVQRGPFLWGRHYHCKISKIQWSELGGTVVASHDGFRRLSGRPVHMRSFTQEGSSISIVDRVAGSGVHRLETRLHLAADCQVNAEGNSAVMKMPGGVIRIVLDPTAEWTSLVGGTDGGWSSPSFNVLRQSTTLVGRKNVELPEKIRLDLHFH